ncbi:MULTISPECIES: DUF6912 family protein [Saccharopolyspora]|jgi:hypothetical protein|uniref:Uncharacterized protein n=3 Tax=Saccharopolyspora TaxID=1835 RepID=A0A4R4VUT8_9PSEU|nr:MULTISPECIES: hypothetical protein [Saccharopolyspora]MBQ0928731.1 hypothetical protein [Saccharopolyspora endophytica]TDD08027.1 hypothetical protein E1181_07510 [Saccharopolyspora terrae]TDD90363.1 hypothetical protein E1202_09335 [Saccharopolyspora karakumensis]
MRIYLPATLPMLQQLVADKQMQPLGGTAFALTPALRESYATGDTEELEYAAMREAARASLRLLAADEEGKIEQRRVVISADVDDVTLRPDLDHAVVKVSGPVIWKQLAAVHVDTTEAEDAVRSAAEVIDAADLGDPDAEFALGDAEDHELAWYAPQEVPFLLELM